MTILKSLSYYLLILLCVSATNLLVAQNRTKNGANSSGSKAQTESNSLMDLSPEDKKVFDDAMKQMGLDKVKGFDQKLASAMAGETDKLPEKDSKRIALIPSKPLAEEDLKAYCKGINEKLKQKVADSTYQNAMALYKYFQDEGYDNQMTSNAAVGTYILGRPEIAMILLGKVAEAAPSNHNNLNNFAALLQMKGAGYKAIPLLNFLNTKYPGNSTILNNLGQAWYELGDTAKAMEHFRNVLKIYPFHSQTNFTVACYFEAIGKSKAAIEHFERSNEESYDEEKVDRIKKIDRNHSGNITPKIKLDPNGLKKINIPFFPESCTETLRFEDTVLDPFQRGVDAEVARINGLLEEAMNKFAANPAQNMVNYVVVYRVPYVANRAKIIQESFYDQEKLYAEKSQEVLEKIAKMTAEHESICTEGHVKQYNTAMYELRNTYAELTRVYAARGIEFALYCNTGNYDVLKYGFMLKYVSSLGSLNPCLKTCTDKTREPNNFVTKLPDYDDTNCKTKSTFDVGFGSIEIACNILKAKMGTDLIGKILKLPGLEETVKLPVNGEIALTQDFRINGDFWDQITKCSVEVSAGWRKKFGDEANPLNIGGMPASVEARADVSALFGYEKGKDVTLRTGVQVGVTGKFTTGPTENSASSTVGGYLEFNSKGLSDVGVTSSAKVKSSVEVFNDDVPGTDFIDAPSASFGKESTYSMNAGKNDGAKPLKDL